MTRTLTFRGVEMPCQGAAEDKLQVRQVGDHLRVVCWRRDEFFSVHLAPEQVDELMRRLENWRGRPDDRTVALWKEFDG
jgi:hypothetical protein